MRELIQQLREEEIFKPAGREEYIKRRQDAFEELKNKFKPGTKVKYYEGFSGSDPYCSHESGSILIGTVLRIYDSSPPPLRTHGPSLDNVILDVEFPEIDRVYNLRPEQVELYEPLVSEAEEIFRPASNKELKTRKEEFKKNLPKTYEEWAKKEGLSDQVAKVFGKYMIARWGAIHLNTTYGEEWIDRFRDGHAYAMADGAGQAILNDLGVSNRVSKTIKDRGVADDEKRYGYMLDVYESVNEQDGEIFKAATDYEVKTRRIEYEIAHRKEMYARIEKLRPGGLKILKDHYKNDAVVEAAIAYADTTEVEELLKIPKNPKGAIADLCYKIRDLDWAGVRTNAETFLRQCAIIDSYNEFDMGVAKQLANDFEFKSFRLAREASVAVYITPMTDDEIEGYDAKQDELDTVIENGSARFWWD